jgi:glycosyltransferase involved in cell wall biosynthesis
MSRFVDVPTANYLSDNECFPKLGIAVHSYKKIPMMRKNTKNLKRRVLLIDCGPQFGGIETYLVSLADLLAGDVDLYVLCVHPELSTRLADRNVKVIRLPYFMGEFLPFRFLATLLVVPLLLLRYRIHTVQLNGFLDSVLLFPARLLGRSAVYTRHGPFEIELYSWVRQPVKLLARKMARWSVHLTTHVVCVSEAVAESVQPVLPDTRYSVIANWVAGQTPFSPPLHLPSRARVLCASRLEHYKGVHLLVEAVRSLPQVELTVVGEGGYRPELEKMASDMPNVRFAGFQRNLESFYDNADIFVMPSMGPEGLPMVCLEAMGHGIPCVFSDLGVHREITDDGKAAYLFRRGDAASLLAGLRLILDSPQKRCEYAEEAHRIVAERYNEGTVRDAYLRVLAG